MSYKIVETVERGKKVLSIVPENWEERGILKWPQKNYETLKLDPNSKPDKSWLPMPCKTKRTKLLSYDSAEIEINIMSDVTDTEMEEEEFCKPPATSKKGLKFDFNDLARSSTTNQENVECVAENIVSDATKQQDEVESSLQEIASSSYIIQETPAAINVEHSASASIVREASVAINVVEEYPPARVIQETPAAINVEESSSALAVQDDPATEVNLQNVYLVTGSSATDLSRESQANIEILSQKIDNLTKIAYELQNNQQNIMLKLALVTTSIEEYIKKITHKENTDAISTNFNPIGDTIMLQNFDSSLENPEVKQAYMKKLSIVCSKGKGRGINNAYVLVDVMFTRKIMTECSWAGGTRKDPKTCFKRYNNTINLFFEIIHNTDQDFTKAECENFFKNVLRHSVARNACQQLRCSSAKRRPKKNAPNKGEEKKTEASSSNAKLSTSQSADEVDKENVNPSTVSNEMHS